MTRRGGTRTGTRAGFPLAWETPPNWAAAALAEPERLLSDHAHCELGAAAAAQGLIGRVPHEARLVDRLAALAAEEMRHFRRVHRVLVRRGGRLEPPRANPYVEGLQAAARRGSAERLLDRLLVAALIERRSLERFELLSEAARGGAPELAELYGRLAPSEAGHGNLFLELARELFGPLRADRRLDPLREAEGELARSLAFAPRIHAGPPAAVAGLPPGVTRARSS